MLLGVRAAMRSGQADTTGTHTSNQVTSKATSAKMRNRSIDMSPSSGRKLLYQQFMQEETWNFPYLYLVMDLGSFYLLPLGSGLT